MWVLLVSDMADDFSWWDIGPLDNSVLFFDWLASSCQFALIFAK